MPPSSLIQAALAAHMQDAMNKRRDEDLARMYEEVKYPWVRELIERYSYPEFDPFYAV
jgi:hypothetical protein